MELVSCWITELATERLVNYSVHLRSQGESIIDNLVVHRCLNHGSFTVERELKKKKEERIAYLVMLCTCARQKNRPTETEIT